jgi:kinesin family protein 18/19
MNDEEITNLVQSIDNISEPFKVYVRIRPFLPKEYQKLRRNNSTSLITNQFQVQNNKNIQILNSIFIVNNKTLYVLDPKHNNPQEKKYYFNKIFTEQEKNKDVFEQAIKPTINNVINGYNSTTLAYGVTGTGKTHTIFGDLALSNGEDGVAIKACEYLFNKLNKEYFSDDYEIKVSYIEIYNENVIDLLNNENENISLMIIEDPNKGVYVHNVKEFIINNTNELKKLICQGNKRRTMAPTNQNKFSSRSHAILQLSLKRKTYNEKKNNFDIYYSKFLIVDLAGSERGGLEKGKRREEGANINKSLFTLGSCINILSDKNRNGKFIPYRDSKLTRLLKDSLGGNILTVMLVCVSPSGESYDESISSLNYANRAKKIKKKIFQNKKEVDLIEENNNEFNLKNSGNNNQYEEIIGSLKNEIFQLKNIIKEQQNKLRNNNININNQTLNLDDDSFTKNAKDENGENINDKLKKFFNDESSIMSNVQIAKSQKLNNNNKEEISLSLIQSINEINLDKYELFFKEIKNKDKDIEIKELQGLIENIKYDKNNLEVFLEHNNIPLNINNNNIYDNNSNNNEKKYIMIKKYYDKFLEIINDKLIENIEQNMVLKCNNKEITELNKNNVEIFNKLQKQLQDYKQNEELEEPDSVCENLKEQIKNMENTIKENLKLKNGILKTYKENMIKKKQLKLILLNLLGDKRENSNKLINILKDKEKLVEKNKQFQKIIEKYTQIQKEKDNNINLIQRQVEMLRSQLKEKEKKIYELKKQQNNIINNSGKKHFKRNNSNANMKTNNLYYIKKVNNNSNNRYEVNNYINKGKRSISCIRNNNLFNYKNTKNKKGNTKLNTYIYCYDESKEGNSISNKNFNQATKISAQINSNQKRRNNYKNRCKSEEMRKEKNKINHTNDINNNSKYKKDKENNNDNILSLKHIYENMNNNIKYINESNQKSDNKKDNNDLLLKYKIADNSINKSNTNINNIKIKNENNYDNSGIKIILDSKFCQRPSNWNLTQKRYEKFMNINTNNNNNINNNNNNIQINNHLINNSLNTNEMNLLVNINNSKKVHKQSNSKKHSLNEARYEKKIKNEISNHEKRRDLSAELNHINAENFINGFKGLKLKQIELLENTANNLKNNIVLTQDTQGTNTTNAYIERNKGINTQNLTINMDNNCQIETKEGDSTNFKTDQSKILKTDDIYQDLVNSLKNAPFKFKHK